MLLSPLAIRAHSHSSYIQIPLYTLQDSSHFSHPNHIPENRMAGAKVSFTFTYIKFSYSDSLDTDKISPFILEMFASQENLPLNIHAHPPLFYKFIFWTLNKIHNNGRFQEKQLLKSHSTFYE